MKGSSSSLIHRNTFLLLVTLFSASVLWLQGLPTSRYYTMETIDQIQDKASSGAFGTGKSQAVMSVTSNEITKLEHNKYNRHRYRKKWFRPKRQKLSPFSTFPAPLKVPFPIFVASFHKSGTTTMHDFFQCGGQRSIHHKTEEKGHLGRCLYENIRDGKDPFADCGDFDVWTDNALILGQSLCWDPAVYSLDAIYQAYPNATLILTVRESFSWVGSIVRWDNLFELMSSCHALWPEQPPNKSPLDVEDIRQFYLWQIQHVRDFAAAHPSMTFLEVGLKDNATASILEERVGIPASCWGKQNVNDHTKVTGEKLEVLQKLQTIN